MRKEAAGTSNRELMSDTATPTATMLRCLEAFGDSEPTRLLVVWIDESGNLHWSASEPYSTTHAIGMIETLKAFLLHQFISPENDA